MGTPTCNTMHLLPLTSLPTTAFHRSGRSILTAPPRRPFSLHTTFNKPRLPATPTDQWQSEKNSKAQYKTPQIQAVSSHPSRPLIGTDLGACFGGGLPVLLASDLNAKHVDWNSRLNTRRGKLLRDYADENSCLIFGPDSPTTIPYNPSATPDILDIVITRQLPSYVHLTSCSALSSDHLPVLIDTGCRSSFTHPPVRPDFRLTDWATPPSGVVALTKRLFTVAHFSMRLCQSGLKNQTANQTKGRHVPRKKFSATLALVFGKFIQGPQPDFKSLA
jgi:hypothetical protein